MNGLSAEVLRRGAMNGAAKSGVRRGLAGGGCIRSFGGGIALISRFFGQLLLTFFFLLALLCQILLAFFELVVWFGQEVTFDGGKCRLERHKSDENSFKMFLQTGAMAATEGAEATKKMIASRGRASYVGERSL